MPVLPTVVSSKKSKSEIKNTICLNNGNLIVSDLSPVEQDIQDEYDFMLNRTKTKVNPRIYHIKSQSRDSKSNISIIYNNYVFGNLILNQNSVGYSEEKLTETLDRKNLVCTIVESFGYVSMRSSESCTNKEQYEMYSKFVKAYPHAIVKRYDGTEILILKVGDIIISHPNRLTEKLDQYIIFVDYRRFLCYGKINFDLISLSENYTQNIANVLLGQKNLNNSRYIGAINGSEIKKDDLPFGCPIKSFDINYRVPKIAM